MVQMLRAGMVAIWIVAFPGTASAQHIFGDIVSNIEIAPLYFPDFAFNSAYTIPDIEVDYWTTVSGGWLDEPVYNWVEHSFSTPAQYGLGPPADVWQPLNVKNLTVTAPVSIPKAKNEDLNLFGTRRTCGIWTDRYMEEEVPEELRKFMTCYENIGGVLFTSSDQVYADGARPPYHIIEECIKAGGREGDPFKYYNWDDFKGKKRTCQKFTMDLLSRQFWPAFNLSSFACSNKFEIPKDVPADLALIIGNVKFDICGN